MTDSSDGSGLDALAARAGVSQHWTDAFGRRKSVDPENVARVLTALGFPSSSEAEITDSLGSFEAGAALPPVLVATAGSRVTLPTAPGRFAIRLEAGAAIDGASEQDGNGARITAPETTGYHLFETAGQECVLAVAPARCFTLGDALAGADRRGDRAWGIATQLYSLRRSTDGGIGDFASLAALAAAASRRGADALSISPVHAQFSADRNRFSPYAPSSRIMHNVLHAPLDIDTEEARALAAAELVDWPAASALRLAALEDEYGRALEAGDLQAFDAWRAEQGDSLELHARFEALHAYMLRHHSSWNWREWPEEFRDPASERTLAFAQARADDIRMHAWFQYRADLGLRDAQQAARDAGMAVGLISDLAVGADLGGSHCWSRQDETLLGLTVGAPPDLLSREGQGWGITAFSPQGLRRNGYRAFIEMLRAALRHAGGVRIDHAMGLNRLWVIPEGASPADGAYLAMPEADLLGLVRLESSRHRAIVLGEDLGTVPHGFADRLGEAGIDGMRVLWFEEDDKVARPPSNWTRGASAMTTTHDLPTVAGWWKGIDLDWNERLGRAQPDAAAERAEARTRLWTAMRASGAASGERPGDWDAHPVVAAAIGHVGRSASELAMIPIEDLLALEQAPNLPGTTDEHPNWRRRLPGEVAGLLDQPGVADRIDAVAETRSSGR